MPHFPGQRLSRCLLTLLALASPLAARGDAGKLAPVIDLNPHQNEAAADSLPEPNALIVAAEVLPLPAHTSPPARQITKPQSDSITGDKQPQPAVKLAAPFDPTIGIRSQKQVPAAQDAAPLTQVRHNQKPIRPAQKPELQRSMLAADRPTRASKLAGTRSPVRKELDRSMLSATSGDQLRRTTTPRTQPFEGHDIQTPRMLATPRSAARSNPVASTADRIAAPKSGADQSSAVSKPQRSAIIQLAAQDPVSANNESETPLPSARGKLLTVATRSSTPLVTQDAPARIEPRKTETTVVLTPATEPAPPAEATSPAEPLFLREQAWELTAAPRKRSLPAVELATNPIARQSRPASLPLQPTLETKREPVLTLVEQNFPEQLAPAESVVETPRPAAATRPLFQITDAKPLWAVLQPSPPSSDLPAPLDEPLTEGQVAEVEELEAYDLDVKSIHELSTCITPGDGELPEDYAAKRFVREGEIAQRMGYSRTQAETWMTWEAPALCYRPLYFQDINLERHGYKVPLIQPALSAAHFFGRVPLLPYMMVSEGHFNCQYTLGHYRPGDYAPYSLYIPRLRLDASAAEAATAAAVILLVP